MTSPGRVPIFDGHNDVLFRLFRRGGPFGSSHRKPSALMRLLPRTPPFCLGAGNTAALFSLIELAPKEAGPFVCDLGCPCVHGLIEEP